MSIWDILDKLVAAMNSVPEAKDWSDPHLRGGIPAKFITRYGDKSVTFLASEVRDADGDELNTMIQQRVREA